MPTTTERLRARWARTGKGPALEAQLRAAEASSRVERARVERLRARDAPEPDATTRARVRVARGEPRAAHPDARRREGALAAARDATRRDARRAAALGDPSPRDARASDPTTTRFAPWRLVASRSTPDATDASPDHLDPADPIVRLKNDASDAAAEATTTSRSRCATGPSARFECDDEKRRRRAAVRLAIIRLAIVRLAIVRLAIVRFAPHFPVLVRVLASRGVAE